MLFLRNAPKSWKCVVNAIFPATRTDRAHTSPSERLLSYALRHVLSYKMGLMLTQQNIWRVGAPDFVAATRMRHKRPKCTINAIFLAMRTHRACDSTRVWGLFHNCEHWLSYKIGLMQAVLNLYWHGAPICVAETLVLAHAHNMLVLVVANACHGLIFQHRPLWVLELASLMLCTFQNGKIRRKPSSSGKVNAVFAQRTKELKMRCKCHISNSAH